MSRDQKMAMANTWILEYFQSLEGLKKEVTELAPGDELLVLACYILQQLATEESMNGVWIVLIVSIENRSLLIELLILLEYGITQSKYSYHIKMMLIGLYNQLGAIYPSVTHYTTLEVKHILLDTLSYVILDDAIRLVDPETAIKVCSQTLDFHEDNNKNTPDYILRSFHNNSFSRVG